MNPNRKIKIEKLTFNIGSGKDQSMLDKGVALIKHITGIAPVKTITNKRIPSWGLRPGLPIGCKLTIRGKKAEELIARLLAAKTNKIKANNFDNNGNVAFGIPEYIDITGVKYVPEIGLMGLEACITLQRQGYRIKKRTIQQRNIPKQHRITRQEAIEFMKEKFKIELEE